MRISIWQWLHDYWVDMIKLIIGYLDERNTLSEDLRRLDANSPLGITSLPHTPTPQYDNASRTESQHGALNPLPKLQSLATPSIPLTRERSLLLSVAAAVAEATDPPLPDRHMGMLPVFVALVAVM